MSMCQALAEHAHDVTLYVRPGTEPVSDDFSFYGVNRTFRIEKLARPQVRVWGAIVNAWLAGKRVRECAPDLIYARELYGLAHAASRGIPFIYELHWKPNHVVEHRLKQWLFRKSSLRRLVFISAALRDLYRATYPWLPEAKLLVAHDGANAVTGGDATAGPASGARLQVGYVGGLLPGYGVEVIAALAQRHADYDFHVVGGRESILSDWRARTVGIGNLTFHGFVAPALLLDCYRSFDVVLAPYQQATRHIDWISPMKLFEYMAHGKAIICADFPVMREILEDQHDALLVSPADLAAYGAALSRLTEPGLRSRLARNAKAKLEREFTWSRRAEAVLTGIAEP
jgi:glycosyltransferase involved in cell wall biosynthesis